MAKEFRWRGKTEEEVKQIDMKEFMGLIDARARRSLQRGLSLVQKRLLKKVDADDKNIRTHIREMVIVPSMIGKTIRIYNGKEFIPVIITIEMLGHRLGEFSHTRKSVAHSSAGVGATRSSKAISAR